ncbi:8136_t:CDS:2 [Paraglomus occultum]|uniref:8136_t:CDS:1 n=1 Tax=Paraglomus occultum TaxID=144539 RepID=A0A9N9G2T8_9GLOM|nr:8136_t:CDS:2 [Paraglomus occultum]
MKPDQHKEENSRRYHAKLRSQGGEAAKEAQEKRRERQIKARRRETKECEKEGGREGKEGAKNVEQTSTKHSYRRRNLGNNLYRYRDPISDDFAKLRFFCITDNEPYDPSAYFQFKEEKKLVEDTQNTDEVYNDLVNIHLDDLELSLSTVSLEDRLNLGNGGLGGFNEMLNILGPIMPRSIRSVDEILTKKSQDGNTIRPLAQAEKPTTRVSQPSRLESTTMKIKDEEVIDDFLKSLDENVVTEATQPARSRTRKPSTPSSSSKISNNIVTNVNDMEKLLDDILGE